VALGCGVVVIVSMRLSLRILIRIDNRLADLIERVGAEDFAEFFEVESVIKPTDIFKTERFRLPAETRDRLRDEAGVRPYKPSIRVR
jgi:hypothetical protein